jgi:hypothetical protein
MPRFNQPLASPTFETAAQACVHWLFNRRSAHFFVFLTALVFVGSARSQGTIVVIVEGSHPATLPTKAVTRVLANRNAEPIGALPMNLEIGDELIGNDQAVRVKVRCNDSADLILSGKFRVRFLRATEAKCTLYFYGDAGARIIVKADAPTNIQSGETKLASKRTVFAVQILGNVDQAVPAQTESRHPDILVYQHEVTVTAPDYSGPVTQGNKLAGGGTAGRTIMQLGPQDYQLTAEAFATIDVGEIEKKHLEIKCPDCAYFFDYERANASLRGLYLKFLEQPDRANLIEVENAREHYGLKPNFPDPSLEPQAESAGIVLKHGQKLTVPVEFANQCSKPIKLRAKLGATTFARLISPAEQLAPAHSKITWQIEVGDPGLAPGTYFAEMVFSCDHCEKQKCGMLRQTARIQFTVR